MLKTLRLGLLVATHHSELRIGCRQMGENCLQTHTVNRLATHDFYEVGVMQHAHACTHTLTKVWQAVTVSCCARSHANNTEHLNSSVAATQSQ